ncbi:MAG: ATP-binding protein [Nitrospirota bacterium]
MTVVKEMGGQEVLLRSNGTLRFLVAAVIEADEQMGELICFEESENGIHSARIPAMIKLLKYILISA